MAFSSHTHPDWETGLLNGFLTVDFETDLLTNDFGTDNWDNDDSVLRDPDATSFLKPVCVQDQLIDSLPEMDLSMPTLPDAPFLNFAHVSTDDDWLLSESLQTEPEAGDLAQSNMTDDWPSSNDVKATTVPTATGGVQKKVSRRRGPKAENDKLINCISFSDLQAHFDKSQAKAAELLGISPTMVKRIAKHHGIKEWPFKKRNVSQ